MLTIYETAPGLALYFWEEIQDSIIGVILFSIFRSQVYSRHGRATPNNELFYEIKNAIISHRIKYDDTGCEADLPCVHLSAD